MYLFILCCVNGENVLIFIVNIFSLVIKIRQPHQVKCTSMCKNLYLNKIQILYENLIFSILHISFFFPYRELLAPFIIPDPLLIISTGCLKIKAVQCTSNNKIKIKLTCTN